MIHLVKGEGATTWCGTKVGRDDIDQRPLTKVTCVECLKRALKTGQGQLEKEAYNYE